MSERKAKVEVSKPKRAVITSAKKAPAAKPQRWAAMPVKKLQKRMSPRTVRGKIALHQKTAAEFRSVARGMLQSGARNLQAGVREMQSEIKDQMNKFKEGAADFQAGVAAILSGIVEQMKENQEYVKQFYG